MESSPKTPDERVESDRADKQALLDLLFGAKRDFKILGSKFDRAWCTLHVENIPTENGTRALVCLTNQAGEELAFSLNEHTSRLVGDYRDYRLTPEQIAAIKRLCEMQ